MQVQELGQVQELEQELEQEQEQVQVQVWQWEREREQEGVQHWIVVPARTKYFFMQKLMKGREGKVG